MAGNIILECKDVRKTFTDNDSVLNGIDLQICEGDFVSILGESGSGKSTLLCIMGGMDKATEGTVLFEGKDLGEMTEKELARLRRTKVGFVFQFFNLAPYLNVKENILLPIILEGISVKKYDRELNELLQYLRIGDFVDKMPSQLSGGEQQRVAIARGLLYKPSIIFLDDPTGNLDVKNSEEIMNLLSQINKERKTTIIQVTHSESNALYGNRIIRIRDGKIVETQAVRQSNEEIGIFPVENEEKQTDELPEGKQETEDKDTE